LHCGFAPFAETTAQTFHAHPLSWHSRGLAEQGLRGRVVTLHRASELGARSITVKAAASGAIDTRMSAWIHQPVGADTLKMIQAQSGVGKPEHIAGVVAFLAGPDGAWSTGQIIDASGGTKL
jgi:3-oxoacyl-[acyl-carrier protein] reductase